jgi:hypothetical protein
LQTDDRSIKTPSSHLSPLELSGATIRIHGLLSVVTTLWARVDAILDGDIEITTFVENSITLGVHRFFLIY